MYKNTTHMNLLEYMMPQNGTKSAITLSRIDQTINWNPIKKILSKYYLKGTDIQGRPAYAPLLLFKMCLLQTWYALSDEQLEDSVNDRLSFKQFCGISLTQIAPDQTVISRFRTILVTANVYDKILSKIVKQLEDRKLIIKTGVIVDASLTPTQNKPCGPKQYELSQPPEQVAVTAITKKGVDPQASWVKKGNELTYGYKRHYAVDAQEGLVLAVCSSRASDHDSRYLEGLLEKLDLSPGSKVYADKGYSGKPNAMVLETKKLKNRIQKKAAINAPLTSREKCYNKLISKIRYKVERTFGSIQRWFKSTSCRYIGLAKAHGQHVLEAIAYNLYRLPGIIMSRGIA